MPRSSVTGTLWRDSWGTAGTQSMEPSPHIEGLGSWAGKMDDRMTFLAFQQTDPVFSEDVNKQYSVGHNEFDKMDQYRIYYGGCHPQLVFGFTHAWGGYVGNPAAGTYSLRLGGIDFGTVRCLTPGGTTVEWYVDIPDSFPTGELVFKFYGASGHDMYFQITVYNAWFAFLPTRLF